MANPLFDIPVQNVHLETPDCLSVILDIPISLREFFTYQAGQYLTLEVSTKKGIQRRAYSLCTAPFEQAWKFTVKKHPKGLVSGALHQGLKAEDVLRVLPPQGRFFIQPDADRRRGYYFVAAGSGITPIMAMIKTILEEEPQSMCFLLYSSRSEEHILFRYELAQIQERYAGQLHIQHTLTRPDRTGWLQRLRGSGPTDWKGWVGRIDDKKLRTFYAACICPYREQHWYLCGPAALMAVCDATLREMNIPPERIMREHFDMDPLEADGPGVAATLTALLQGKEIDVAVAAGQTLLASLLTAGYEVPYSCASGACASCMAKVTEGEVYMPHAPALEKEEIAEGYILTCQAKAKSAHVHIAYP